VELLDKNGQTPKHHYWMIAGAILSAVIAMFTVDHYCPTFAIENKMPGDLRAFFQCIGFFGHGTGCLIAVSLIWSLDRRNKTAIPLVIGSTLLAGAITTVVKILVHRPRPFVDQAALGDSVTLSDAVFHNFLQSFPSGHTAIAFALAMALSMLYRQGKPVFLIFAAFVAVQRVISQNHFPSDVIAGAVVGLLSAQTVQAIVQQRLKSSARSPRTVDQRKSGRRQKFSGTSPV
jgi:membrane-associated phospholipid phosphatase